MSEAKTQALEVLKREAALFMRRLGHNKDTSSPQFVEACRVAESFGISLEQIDEIIDEAARSAA